MSVTQKDIADRLNISRSLVARALKEYPEVAESTRLRVRAIALEMGYDASANREARMLIGRRYGQQLKTGSVAVAFPVMEALSPRYIPFYRPVLDAIEAEAKTAGVELCLCTFRRAELPRLIREKSVDGVLLLGDWPAQVHVAAIHELGLPVVTFQSRCEGTHSVMADDREGARLATSHLLDLGHRRIGYLGVENGEGHPGHLRLQGYLDAMREYGVSVAPEWVGDNLPAPATSADSYCYGCNECAACTGWDVFKRKSKAAKGQLPFTALVCINDPVAIGVIAHARADGVDVPGDLSVVGFDNVSRDFHSSPVVTSVDFSRYDMGREAMRLLHTAISGGEVENQGGYTHAVFPTHLELHQSTQAPAVNEQLMVAGGREN